MQTRSQSQPIAAGAALAPLWALYSWPTVFWRPNGNRRPRFRHLATRVTTGSALSGACSGHTVWGGFSGDGDAGLAWDWIEVARGVVAMVDPMQVVTNMQL